MIGQTLVLLSGGIDSCATLALYRRRMSPAPSALFVDYGQAAGSNELSAAQKIAAHYQISLSAVRCSGLGEFGAGYVRARNALLLHIGLAAARFEAGQIAIGLHAGTPYPDCTPAFLEDVQRTFDLYCGGKIRAVAPFLDQDKPAVLEFCRQAEVPVQLTYSCERGSNPPCGSCLSCLDRAALNVE